MAAEPGEVRLRAVGMTPVGALDLAPPQRPWATARVGGKSSGRWPANTNDQPKRSASVTWPVASTKAANSPLVTVWAARAVRRQLDDVDRALAVAVIGGRPDVAHAERAARDRQQRHVHGVQPASPGALRAAAIASSIVG